MILTSRTGKKYIHFNWQLYASFYPLLSNYGFKTKNELWWHFVNIGEPSGYIYFDNNDYSNYVEKYNNFDYVSYQKIIGDNSKTKDELWWHYIVTNNCYKLPIDTTSEANISQLKQLQKNKHIYYFIHHTSENSIRTGIQIVTIYLAKELLKLKAEYDFELIFVKWDFNYNCIVTCSQADIDKLFHLDDTDIFIEKINYPSSVPIHTNTELLVNGVFFCPEIIFVIEAKLPFFLKKYLERYKLKSIYLLYDIIPLVIPEYNIVKKEFNEYFTNNILCANKIITISDFTKDEFTKYSIQNNLINKDFPITESLPLPYQYRNKLFVSSRSLSSSNNNKITILLPGTVEPRKQQVVLMKMFNKFIKQNPNVNVTLIVFGNVISMCLAEFSKELELSNGKIIYLGTITNTELFYLYSTATFSCYISKYEGFGFPIAESLWHGTPVLTSNFGSMKEVASVGGCYCVDTNNVDEIYNGLNNLIMNSEITNKLKSEINDQKMSTWKQYSINICEKILNI